MHSVCVLSLTPLSNMQASEYIDVHVVEWISMKS